MPRHFMTFTTTLVATLIMNLFMCLIVVPTQALAATKSNRQKVIDFEDEVVEGVNKRPLDSLNQIAERNRKKQKPHLYRKRVGFRTETNESLRTLRYTQ